MKIIEKLMGEEEAQIKALLEKALAMLGVQQKEFEKLYNFAKSQEDFFHCIMYVLHNNNYFCYLYDKEECLDQFFARLHARNNDADTMLQLSFIPKDILPKEDIEEACLLNVDRANESDDEIRKLYGKYAYFVFHFDWNYEEEAVLIGLLHKEEARQFLLLMHEIKRTLPSINFSIALMGVKADFKDSNAREISSFHRYQGRVRQIKKIATSYNNVLVDLYCFETESVIGKVTDRGYGSIYTYNYEVWISPEARPSDEQLNKSGLKLKRAAGNNDSRYHKELDTLNSKEDFKYVFSNILNNEYNHATRMTYVKLDEGIKNIIRNELVGYNNKIVDVHQKENGGIQVILKKAFISPYYRNDDEGAPQLKDGAYWIGNQYITTEVAILAQEEKRKAKEKESNDPEKVSIVKNIRTSYNNVFVNLICKQVVHSLGSYGSREYVTYNGYYWKMLFNPYIVDIESHPADEELEKLGFELKPIENELYYQKELEPLHNKEDFEYICTTLLNNEYDSDTQMTFAKLDEDFKSIISKELVLCNNTIVAINKEANAEIEIVLSDVTLPHYISEDPETGYVPKFRTGRYCVGNQCITTTGWIKERECKARETAIIETMLRKLEEETGKTHTIEDLKELKEIDLSGLGIQELNFLRYCPNLEILNLNMNNISDLLQLYFTRKLKKLFVSNNKITDINLAFRYCLDLEELDLSNNEITEIHASAIPFMKNLKRLNLSNNKLYLSKEPLNDFSCFESMKNLEYLNLNNTNIK